MNPKRNKIYIGHNIDVMKKWNDGCIDFAISSPPYFGLREYETVPAKWKGWNGEIGMEPTIKMYINNLCDVFDEVKRVLKPYGTLFVNLGDSMSGSGGAGGDWNDGKRKESPKWRPPKTKHKNGCFLMIPARFAIEMIDNRGWILRNPIIWEKPNVTPQSAKDRYTIDYEYLFFFSKFDMPLYYINKLNGKISWEKQKGIKGKENIDWYWTLDKNENIVKRSAWFSRKYYFKQQFEPLSHPNAKGMKFGGNKHKGYKNPTYSGNKYDASKLIGKNKRSIWKINTSSYKDAHYAVFPKALIESPIDACCPKDVCNKCGLPKVLITEKYDKIGYNLQENSKFPKGTNASELEKKCVNERSRSKIEAPKLFPNDIDKQKEYIKFVQKHGDLRHQYKWTKCGCNAGHTKGVVLDMFGGVATTALVAMEQKKDFLIIEISKKFANLGYERIREKYSQKRLY